MLKCVFYYQDNEFYFDRDPATFNCVLNFYRTERLHIIDEVRDTSASFKKSYDVQQITVLCWTIYY